MNCHQSQRPVGPSHAKTEYRIRPTARKRLPHPWQKQENPNWCRSPCVCRLVKGVVELNRPRQAGHGR
ncbi:MAG: hypothetical protein NC819_00355 [Candidatus Omnitrophica bacterium]|nr:hypothetical protein [Candidatus Omnitrophota bacterium]